MLHVTVRDREDLYRTRRSKIQIHVVCDKMQRKLICNTNVSEELAARILRVGCRISGAGVFRDRVHEFSVRKSAIMRIRDNFSSYTFVSEVIFQFLLLAVLLVPYQLR